MSQGRTGVLSDRWLLLCWIIDGAGTGFAVGERWGWGDAKNLLFAEQW